MRPFKEETAKKKLEEVKKLLKKRLPERLFEIVRCNPKDKQTIEKLVEFILDTKEEIDAPLTKDFPYYLWHKGAKWVYEEICGDPSSELYLPIFDFNTHESSKYYAPGLLLDSYGFEDSSDEMKFIILKKTSEKVAKELEKEMGELPRPTDIIQLIRSRHRRVYKIWEEREKIFGRKIKPREFCEEVGINTREYKPRRKVMWTKDRVIEEIVNKIERELPDFVKKVRFYDLSKSDDIKDFETWILENDVKLPNLHQLKEIDRNAVYRRFGSMISLYEEAFGKKGSKYYIPFLDPESDHYAPWILFKGIHWKRKIKEKGMRMDEWAMKKVVERCGGPDKVTEEEMIKYRLSGIIDKTRGSLKALLKYGYITQEEYEMMGGLVKKRRRKLCRKSEEKRKGKNCLGLIFPSIMVL